VGIGAGNGGKAGKITITGGTVNAYGEGKNVGIGGGNVINKTTGEITITGGMIYANNRGASNSVAIGSLNNSANDIHITGGSIKTNDNGIGIIRPQPTNGDGKNVYLNTLTVDYSTKNLNVTNFYINNIACSTTPNASAGVYGIKNVKTDGDNKLYFYLPITLSGANASSFELSATSITPIPVGDTGGPFTVKPKAGLAAGTHTATVKVSLPGLSDSYSKSFDVSFTVKQKDVSITSATIAAKTYDGTNTATLSNATFSGYVSSEGPFTASDYTVNATFDDANMGTNKPVTANITLKNTELAKNYNLTNGSSYSGLKGNITAKPITITGLTAKNKEYDGNNKATPDGTAVLDGNLDSDNLTVTAGSANFADKNVGDNKDVTFTGYSLDGSAVGNYTLTGQPATVKANITAKSITITGLGADNKTYDGNTTASITGTAVLDGNLDSDNLTVTAGSANFADKNVGDNKDVTFTGYSLDGSEAENYTLSAQPADVTADITAKSVTITGLDANDKVYDGTAAATVTGTAAISGKESGDDLDVSAGTASFDNKNVDNNKTVTFTGYSLTGTDAGNYNLSVQPASVTADITAATLTVTPEAAQSKIYGTTDPTLIYTATGWQGSDGVSLLTGALDRIAGEDIDTYAIGQGTLTETSGNYIISFTSGVTFAIIKLTPEATGLGAVTAVRYDGSTTPPTDAGTYAVTVDIAAGTLYAAITDLTVGTFTVAKAVPTAAHFDIIADTYAYYTDEPQTVDVPTLLAPYTGLGDVTVKYNGSDHPPVDLGEYAITLDIAEGANFAAVTGLPAGRLVISVDPATAIDPISATRVWSYGNRLYIAAPATSGQAYIYNISGLLVKIVTHTAGETTVTQLPAGIYVAVVERRSYLINVRSM
jgi:hypothetical protein